MEKRNRAINLAREAHPDTEGGANISAEHLSQLHDSFTELETNVRRVIIGKDDVVRRVLVAFVSGGHVLLEDVPGVGKTTLAKSIARSVSATYNRIQFTPDLLPSDITGSTVYSPKREEFYWSPGPIFANIILADEINRTSPRTQSALLEAMEENQVTADRTTHRLPFPFFVIATQNSHEVHGTFPLPEGQVDRFLMSLSIGLPDRINEQRMLRDQMVSHPIEELQPVITASRVVEMQEAIRQVSVSEKVLDYVLDLIGTARRHDDVSLGPSPRASLALVLASQGMAFAAGRSYAIPDDVRAISIPVLSHRISPRGRTRTREHSRQVVEAIVTSVRVPV